VGTIATALHNLVKYRDKQIPRPVITSRGNEQPLREVTVPDYTPMKQCGKCGVEKPATATYFRRKAIMRDGLNSQCKDCVQQKSGSTKRFNGYENVSNGHKRCSICLLEYPANKLYFYGRKSNRDGLQPRCIMCCKTTAANHYQCNIEKHKAWRKKYDESHKEENKLRQKRWYENNRKHVKHYRKQWYENNREHFLHYIRSRRLENKVIRANRRARLLNLPNNCTTADWKQCLEYFNNCCAVCGRPRGLWHTLAQDHWIPLKSVFCPGTMPKNIVPLCHGQGGCNNSKGAKLPEKWLIETYGKRKTKEILDRINQYFNSIK
jgi:hypothetical protein